MEDEKLKIENNLVVCGILINFARKICNFNKLWLIHV